VYYHLDAPKMQPLKAPNVENEMKKGVIHENEPIVFSLNVNATASDSSISLGDKTKK
jgi:hypothetical protein